jgi:histidyl-tRNA synthetase
LAGFQQIETPAMEQLNTLMGKYGEEGDRLIFKILNSGDFLAKAPEQLLQNKDSQTLTTHISEKALRYDLTVPFARFVVQNQSALTFPFKRYQIQPVWRADRPQKGRYREFYQCDADVVGSKSLVQEAELTAIYLNVFKALHLPVTVKINHRKLLAALAAYIGETEKSAVLINALDKTDKIGVDGVLEILRKEEISEAAIKKLIPILELSGNFTQKLTAIKPLFANQEEGALAIAELEQLEVYGKALQLDFDALDLDLKLARGLNYYTGCIFEVVANNVALGSIGGGGRYDDLTGIFGMPGLSGVGISFGLDRIYLALEQSGLFEDFNSSPVEVLFINFGTREALVALGLVQELRTGNITAELYPDAAKIKKQMDYANRNNIPFVAILGESELANGTLQLKNMKTGTQTEVPIASLLQQFSN